MILYRPMSVDELVKLSSIDRREHVSVAFENRGGNLHSKPVDWDVPGFLADGDGAHSVAEQVRFCLGHLRAGGRMIGAFDGENLAGVGVWSPHVRPAMAQLAYLMVSRDYRRRGLASRLLQDIISDSLRVGCTRLYVSATPSESAVGFYRAHGFVVAREPLVELLALEPEDIHMILEIGPAARASTS
jgi:GNAT superfamily N-acetyltransferase